MAVKIIDIPDVGPVQFIKSSRSRSIRLSVTSKGVRVSLPHWVTYTAAVRFARQHSSWISSQLQTQAVSLLTQGDKIGKLHTLQFEKVPQATDLRAKVTPTKLIVPYHPSETYENSEVQARAEQAALRALRKEASVLLPQRLAKLAAQYMYTYKDVSVRNLKRRWGSCDSKQHIVLNIFLMQLSWEQIDYVICHELAHTKHMHHGPAFWQEVESMMPDARMIAKRVRYIQPALQPTKSATALDDDMAY